MAAEQMIDSLLAAAALASTILLLGVVFILILRTPKFQFSLRFLLLTMGCIAISLGLWTALLRGFSHQDHWAPGIDYPEPAEMKPLPEPLVPGLENWNEYMDGPYEPKPIGPASKPSSEGATDPER